MVVKETIEEVKVVAGDDVFSFFVVIEDSCIDHTADPPANELAHSFLVPI